MGLEVVVRPVVLPNIRPSTARRIAPPDDPAKGLCVLSGGGGQFIGISSSWSVSVSKQKPHKETKRQVDVERVYQMDDQGNINKSNFIDVERLKKVRLQAGDDTQNRIYAPPPQKDNVEIQESDKTIQNPDDSGG